MSELKHIIFLYSQRLVPPQIIQMAQEQVPAGFALHLLDQDSPAGMRLEKFAQADCMFAYPGNPAEQELAAGQAPESVLAGV